MLTKVRIDKIQDDWKNLNKLPINNPRGYADPKKHHDSVHDPEKQQIRLNDLKGLLKIFYTEICDKRIYYVSGKNDTTQAFEKYIFKTVIRNFPFFSKDKAHSPKCFLEEGNTPFNEWILQIFNGINRVQWTPKIDYPSIENIQSKEATLAVCELRLIRFSLLAKICYFIDVIQVEDYRRNEIHIKNDGKFEGNFDNLAYGDKHALSAYLGHWIIRHFPFKDFKGFCSKKYNGTMSIYEHYTPMSFFRDLIWVKEQQNEDVFNYKSVHSRPFSTTEWLSILWYRYRTISITKNEDDSLSTNKEKSRRSAGNLAYKDAGIELNEAQERLWQDLHSLEMLSSVLKSNI
jgi:hypothetical protein